MLLNGIKNTMTKEPFVSIIMNCYNGKKFVGNKLNLILTRGFGDMFMHEVVPDEKFVAVAEECLKSYRSETTRG